MTSGKRNHSIRWKGEGKRGSAKQAGKKLRLTNSDHLSKTREEEEYSALRGVEGGGGSSVPKDVRDEPSNRVTEKKGRKVSPYYKERTIKNPN